MNSNLLYRPSILFLMALATEPAYAQELSQAPEQTSRKSMPATASDGELSEIVVTAQKRSENLQRVPITITAVSPVQMARMAITSTADIGAAVPGLSIVNVGGVLAPRLRGVGNVSTAAGNESPVAVYVDGIYYPFGADINLDVADVTQLAVLRGPQGTLFGRNATGGVVQFTTRAPRDEFEVDLVTSLDNYLTSRSYLFLGGALSERLKASLSASFATQGKGWGTNLFDGEDTHRIRHDATLRGKLVYQAGRTEASLSFDYNNKEDDLALNYRPFPGYSVRNPSPQSPRPWDSNNYYPSSYEHEGWGTALTINHELDFAKLVSISGYRDGSAELDFLSGAGTGRGQQLNIPFYSKQVTQEVQLVSNTSGPFSWVAGAYYFWNRAESRFSADIYVTPTSTTAILVRNNGRQFSSSFAAFAQATYSITPTTRITGGVRYTYERKRVLGVSGGVPQANRLSFEKPTFRFSSDQDIGPNVMAYASFNTGFKSGGFSTTSPNNPPIDPEVVDAYEAGFKSQLFDRRLRLNGSAFYYEYTGIQVGRVGPPPAIFNADGAKIYGFDAEVEVQVRDGLHANLSAEWLHSEFLNFPGAQFTIPLPNNEGATVIAGQARGNRLPFAPRLTLSAGIDYKFDTRVGQITLAASDSYNSGYYGEADNRLFQKSFHLMNVSAGWQSSDGAFGARLWLNNILNEAVATQITSQASGYLAGYSSPPRTIGITLSAAIR